jgi:cupin fold WbuC family metalloprotein
MERVPRLIAPGVWAAADDPVAIAAGDLAFLGARLPDAAAGRVRLCAHADPALPLHEMFILLSDRSYIRPHAHPGKAESLLVLEGEAEAVFFDDDGGVTGVVGLGDYASGGTFYYRVDAPVYHTLLLRTPRLLFHEATTGPFRREETRFAPWAPPDDAGEAELGRYRNRLAEAVARYRGERSK